MSDLVPLLEYVVRVSPGYFAPYEVELELSAFSASDALVQAECACRACGGHVCAEKGPIVQPKPIAVWPRRAPTPSWIVARGMFHRITL